MKKKEMKEKYVAPAIEVIEVENEGVMAASGGASVPGIGSGTWGTTRSGVRNQSKSYQSAGTLQELEDLINDILTVKK